jgi:anti-sigma regulatory factor (Ser/Thr protein kinase)
MTDPLTQPSRCDHVVQFYLADADLAEHVAVYLGDAIDSGAVAIVIATPAHARAFETRLAASGIDVAAAAADGSYAVLDAEQTLARFMVDGRPDARRFDDEIGELVRSAAAGGRRVCAYGEMVALLWDDGRVNAAIQLESLWNDLSKRVPFSLFCSYPSVSATGEDQTEALTHVCGMHSAVIGADPRRRAVRRFVVSPEGPREARGFVLATLEEFGCEELATDAALVVTELATNAIEHARSDFTVSVVVPDAGVRIEVRDWSPLEPRIQTSSTIATSGRGLLLVDALASAWGIVRNGDVKVVWAQLAGNGFPLTGE